MLFKQLFKLLFYQLPIVNFGLAASLGIATATTATAPLPEIDWNLVSINQKASIADNQTEEVPHLAQANSAASRLAEGTYIYGHSSEPNVIGQEYLVFQVQQDDVVGAFYMPHSEFACFYGSMDKKKMDLTIVDPYGQGTYSHTIALEQQSLLASDSDPTAQPVGLVGYRQVPQVSENDQNILNTCLQEHQN